MNTLPSTPSLQSDLCPSHFWPQFCISHVFQACYMTPCSQPATDPCHETDVPNPQNSNSFFLSSILILSSNLYLVLRIVSSLQIFHQNIVWISHLPMRTTCLAMRILIMHCPPASRYFVLHRFKYSPQHPGLRHLNLLSFLSVRYQGSNSYNQQVQLQFFIF
jgi:hypothetical protein